MEDLHLTYQQFHATPDALTIDQLEAALRGELQIYIDGNVRPMRLSTKELTAFDRAKQRHFVVEEDGSRLLEGAYHTYCVIMQSCCVRVVLHPKRDECRISEEHAAVWYDLFRLRHALTPDALQAIRQCFDRARSNYQDTSIDLGVTGGFGIVPEYASEKLAAALWQILATPDTHTAQLFQQKFPHIRE